MTSETYSCQSQEAGFTLIELLVAVAIIGILAAIAISTFSTYRDNAIFSKAQSDLRNARVALEAGADDLLALGNIDEWSGNAGGPVVGNLAIALPSMYTSEGAMLRVVLTDCGVGGKTMVHMFSYACQPELVTWWFRTCGDFEMQLSRAPAPGIC